MSGFFGGGGGGGGSSISNAEDITNGLQINGADSADNLQTTVDVNGNVAVKPSGNRFAVEADYLELDDSSGTNRGHIVESGNALNFSSTSSAMAFLPGGSAYSFIGYSTRFRVMKTIELDYSSAPASASDTGTTGQVAWDANYLYVCTATNTWKRSALSTW